MDASAAAVLGALVGAAGGIAGGILTFLGQGRSQRAQHRADFDRWRLSVRRDAYSRLVAATKQLSNSLWQASDQLRDPGCGTTQWQTAFRVVHDAWTEFSSAAAEVSVAGPAGVAEAAGRLRADMYEWEMICTRWIREAVRTGHGTLQDYGDRFHTAARAKRPAEAAFQAAARAALGTDR